MNINTRFSIGSIIKLNMKRAHEQLQQCFERAKKTHPFYSSDIDTYWKPNPKLEHYENKLFVVVRIETDFRPITKGKLEVTYTLAEVDTSKEIDVLKLYNLASKHWISNEVNNGMYFKIVEDLFDEVEYNK